MKSQPSYLIIKKIKLFQPHLWNTVSPCYLQTKFVHIKQEKNILEVDGDVPLKCQNFNHVTSFMGDPLTLKIYFIVIGLL